MAPGALFEHPDVPDPFKPCDGHALETTSDLIDDVNVLKDKLKTKQPTTAQPDTDIYTPSHFDTTKDKSTFRQYTTACSRVRAFYLEQHTKQTVAYNLLARNTFHAAPRAHMTVWQALEKLNTLIDDSDPDTSLSQVEHLLQAAEAMRRDAQPRWMQLVGLIHDLGKLLYFHGARGQWDVVGDTFPVGCAFSDRIVYADTTFAANPDARDDIYASEHGIYTPGCGLDRVMLSWGHDEYLYHVMKTQSRIPEEGLAMIRYHSFYAWHSEGAYRWMMNEKDERMLAAVRAFNPYDLYSKSDEVPRVEELKEYYQDIIDEFIGKDKVLAW
ncbi:inositol oxygenase 1 [Massariosphaeria phaeospora]|uniref:Inositol oxygenase n=1 Tax=Massariosphaeria phaeospora TaxID=100035 RepID=A0A7C8MG01_9PLEO|nr:inositol oxygenase 1 [Massariosphaeria phaeospora]